MKLKTVFVCAIMLTVACTSVFAAGQKDKKAPNLDGAYKYVSTKFPGGEQTEAQAKGMIVVHDKYMSFVRAGVDRKTWDQSEPQDERTKKIVAAYQGLAATCGEFTVNGNIIALQQLAQASPLTMGKEIKWEYKLEGKMLKLKPVANLDVEFTFERLP